jgi:integrase
MRITERNAKSAAVPADRQAIYFDDDVKGFGVRVTSSGCRSYIVEVRRGSRSQRITIGRVAEISAAEAREQAIDVKRGGLGKRERYRATVKDAWDRYAADRRQALAPTTRKRVESRVRVHVLPSIGHIRLVHLTSADVTRLTDTIQGAVLANRTLEYIRAILNHALNLGWTQRNVALNLRKRREVPRERYLRPEEVLILFDALPDIPSADLIRFLVLTGCRLSEARQLMWSDIQGDVWIKRAETTKARRSHAVPLLSAALALIGRQRPRGSYVFSRADGGPIGSIQKVWETARRNAGFPGLRVHDLRHTVASLALQRGVSLPMVGRMLGHSTPAVTNRYAHLELEDLRDSFAKVPVVGADSRKESEHGQQ